MVSLALPVFLWATLISPSEESHAAGTGNSVIVDPNNRAWLTYDNNTPFFLASPGDPEDFLYRGSLLADGTRSGDQDFIISKLSATGANGIYMQMIRSHGGDGNATHNPFVDNDPAQGLNQAVLDQWDGWFSEMDRNGIVIYLFFYDDSASVWGTGSTVGDAERQFFTSIVDRFEHHGHLIWVIAEEYAERFGATRVSQLAQIIRETDDQNHAIAVHKNSGTSFQEFADDPNIDQFAMQYNVTSPDELHAAVLSARTQAAGRYNVNMSEATQWGTGATARRKAWAVAMGGAYVMGLGMNIADTPLSDLEDLGRLRLFMESTSLVDLSPRDDLAAGESDWVLANPGDKYIIYGASVASALGLTLTDAATYDLRWFDPVTGNSITQKSLQLDAGMNSWQKPASFGDEVALYLTKSGDEPVSTPRPPTNLTTN